MEQPLLPVKTKTTYITEYITISEYTQDKNNHPTTLITSNGNIYNFFNLVYFPNLIQLKKILSKGKKIKIIYDNNYYIHKIGDIPFSPRKDKLYNQLKIISLTKGLIFDKKVEINNFDNIKKFYELHNLYNIFYEGSEIIVIICDVILTDIPLIY